MHGTVSNSYLVFCLSAYGFLCACLKWYEGPTAWDISSCRLSLPSLPLSPFKKRREREGREREETTTNGSWPTGLNYAFVRISGVVFHFHFWFLEFLARFVNIIMFLGPPKFFGSGFVHTVHACILAEFNIANTIRSMWPTVWWRDLMTWS